MGAGASAGSMPLEDRTAMYETMKGKYTKADLDALEEEEKQAWMEVLTGRKGSEPAGAAGDGDISTQQGAAKLAETAPEAAAANTAADLSGGGVSAAVLGGSGGNTIRPQGRSTRMSYHLASEVDGTESSICIGGSVSRNEGGERAAEGAMLGGAVETEDTEAGVAEAGIAEEGVAGGVTGARVTRKIRRLSAEIPTWKRAAIEMESHAELSVGDVVRARDKTPDGMWFEGILTAIHDECTFTVELTNHSQSGNVDYITVGIDDLVRVMPWFCIEVGDIVEFQVEEAKGWLRGTVMGIDSTTMIYDVVLDYEPTDTEVSITVESMDDEYVGRKCNDGWKERERNVAIAYRVTDDSIRKICSGRQAVARQWKEGLSRSGHARIALEISGGATTQL